MQVSGPAGSAVAEWCVATPSQAGESAHPEVHASAATVASVALAAAPDVDVPEAAHVPVGALPAADDTAETVVATADSAVTPTAAVESDNVLAAAVETNYAVNTSDNSANVIEHDVADNPAKAATAMGGSDSACAAMVDSTAAPTVPGDSDEAPALTVDSNSAEAPAPTGSSTGAPVAQGDRADVLAAADATATVPAVTECAVASHTEPKHAVAAVAEAADCELVDGTFPGDSRAADDGHSSPLPSTVSPERLTRAHQPGGIQGKLIGAVHSFDCHRSAQGNIHACIFCSSVLLEWPPVAHPGVVVGLPPRCSRQRWRCC